MNFCSLKNIKIQNVLWTSINLINNSYLQNSSYKYGLDWHKWAQLDDFGSEAVITRLGQGKKHDSWPNFTVVGHDFCGFFKQLIEASEFYMFYSGGAWFLWVF